MKRLTAILLALTLVLAFAACGQTTPAESAASGAAEAPSAQTAAAPAEPETAEQSAEEAAELASALEEYIEYLAEHPHIALFVDNMLKYEVYRQPVGESNEINVQLTGHTDYESSLDNMGCIITVFNHNEITEESTEAAPEAESEDAEPEEAEPEDAEPGEAVTEEAPEETDDQETNAEA